MKNIHIENSYNIWSTGHMWAEIVHQCLLKYGSTQADKILNRSWTGMYIEWWLHNIGYYLTLPFLHIPTMKFFNERFKHIDLEEHK